ncbi:MAG: alpha/beta fold hydrolase [Pseudomonadota bacterium]
MTPIVLVHGFLGGSAQWQGQVAALSDICNVVTVDLPGFGAMSDMSPIPSIGGMADWVLTQLTQRDIEQCHLLGHSMGGMVAQAMAVRAPSRIATLILYATGPLGTIPGRFETMAQSKARAHTDGPAATAKRIAAKWFAQGSQSPAYKLCADIACQASADAIRAGLDAMDGWSGEDHLPRLSHETLIIWGDLDRSYPWDQISRLWQDIPKASLAIVPRCGHAVHLENPPVFNMHVRDWLEGAR